MKTILCILLISFLITSCGNQGDGGEVLPDAAPTGTIAKQWVGYAPEANFFAAKAVDLSSGTSATFSQVRKTVRKHNGSREYFEHTISGCTLSIDGGTPVANFTIIYQATLTSGNPDVCNAFVPSFSVRHYRSYNQDFDILRVAGAHMK